MQPIQQKTPISEYPTTLDKISYRNTLFDAEQRHPYHLRKHTPAYMEHIILHQKLTQNIPPNDQDIENIMREYCEQILTYPRLHRDITSIAGGFLLQDYLTKDPPEFYHNFSPIFHAFAYNNGIIIQHNDGTYSVLRSGPLQTFDHIADAIDYTIHNDPNHD